VGDAGLGLFGLRQFHEVLALQCEQPGLVDQRAALDGAAAQRVGDAAGDRHVVLGSEVAGLQVDQRSLEGCRAGIAGDRYRTGGQGRAPAAFGQGRGDLPGDVEQLVGVEHHDVRIAQQAQLLGLHGAA
jgi:hypothetical protein